MSTLSTFPYPMYPPAVTSPMEAELVRAGLKPLHTVPEVESVFSQKSKTVFLMVNSVCGCAAGNARPAVEIAMKNGVLPAEKVTVFAGVDREATTRAREYAKEIPPSSPSMFLFKDGKLVFSLQRHQIQGRDPQAIAGELVNAFNAFSA